jgi:hypothetical protein
MMMSCNIVFRTNLCIFYSSDENEEYNSTHVEIMIKLKKWQKTTVNVQLVGVFYLPASLILLSRKEDPLMEGFKPLTSSLIRITFPLAVPQNGMLVSVNPCTCTLNVGEISQLRHDG